MIEGLLALIAAMGAAVAFLFNAWRKQVDERKEAEIERDKATGVIKDVEEVRKIENNINTSADGSADRLRDRWSRD